MRKVLVTGANGYLGSNIVHSLWEDNDVSVMTRAECDMTDIQQVTNWFAKKNQFFDVVVHAAAVGGSRLKQDDNTVYAKNMNMFLNLHANKHYFKKMVFLSSGAATYMPESPYGKAKKHIENIVRTQYDVQEREIIKIYNVFDHNEKPTRFINSAIKKLLYDFSDTFFVSNRFMSFYHMEDFITVIKESLFLHSTEKDYVLAYERTPPKLKDIAEYIINLHGKTGINISENPNMLPEYYGPTDSDNLVPYGWAYRMGLYGGIKKTYALLKARAESRPHNDSPDNNV